MTNSTNFSRDNSRGFEIEFLFGILGSFEHDHRSRNMNFVCNSVENYVYFPVETLHPHPLNLLQDFYVKLNYFKLLFTLNYFSYKIVDWQWLYFEHC